MTVPFTESDADHLIMVFDDEELLPGAIGAMLDRAADDPTAAFVAGRFLYRDADGRTMRSRSRRRWDLPPARMTGDEFIRMAYRSGAWTWICSVMFNRRGWCQQGARAGHAVRRRRTAAALRHARAGAYLDRATTTKTDGNIGESIRDGLTEAETLESRNVIRLSGILGFRHTLEKFLFEANDHFTAKERRAMLYDLDNFCASLLGDRLADVRKVSDETKVRQELRESLDLVHGIRREHGSSAGASNGAGRDEVRRVGGRRCLPRRGRAARRRARVLSRPGAPRSSRITGARASSRR